MKVEKVIPCVCVPHPPGVGDSVLFGMPVIHTNGHFFSCQCPVCGRGNKYMEHSSAYKALRAWNRMQETCYRLEKKEIIYEDDDYEKYFTPYNGKKPEYKSKWDEI